MQDIEDTLAEIQRKTAEAKENGQRLATQQISEEIPGKLGSISVSGHGQLLNLSLNRDHLKFTNEHALAREIVETLERAEEKARSMRTHSTNI